MGRGRTGSFIITKLMIHEALTIIGYNESNPRLARQHNLAPSTLDVERMRVLYRVYLDLNEPWFHITTTHVLSCFWGSTNTCCLFLVHESQFVKFILTRVNIKTKCESSYCWKIALIVFFGMCHFLKDM